MSEVAVESKPAVYRKSAGSLWHEIMSDLSFEKQLEWKAKGFPYDPYDPNCAFCTTVLGQERSLYHGLGHSKGKAAADELLAGAEAKNREAIAQARRQGRREGMEAAAPKELLATLDRALTMHTKTVQAITEQTVNVNLPDSPGLTIEKGAIQNLIPQPQVNFSLKDGDDDDDSEVKAISFDAGILAVGTDQIEIVNHPTRQDAYFVRRKDAQS